MRAVCVLYVAGKSIAFEVRKDNIIYSEYGLHKSIDLCSVQKGEPFAVGLNQL